MRKIRRNDVRMSNYEGAVFAAEMNQYHISGKNGMMDAYRKGCLVEAKAVSAGGNGSLIFHFGDDCIGFISAEEYSFNQEVTYTPKMHCINKVQGFFVTGYQERKDGTTEFILSRREVQKVYFENYISKIADGEIIPAKVRRVESKYCFVDLGHGYKSVLYKNNIGIGYRGNLNAIFRHGDYILCQKTGNGTLNRIKIEHRSLLGSKCRGMDELGIGVGDTATGVLTGYRDNNVAYTCLSIGVNALLMFNEDSEERPPVGEIVNMTISDINREKDRISAGYKGIADRMPDFRDFSYFLPENSFEHSETEAA